MVVIYVTFAVAKRKLEKTQACTGFEPLTSAIRRPAPSWLVSLIDRAPVSHRSRAPVSQRYPKLK